MSSEDNKPWERPWTTQEMIENASNWNLAGDAGLLKYLEQFSDNMLSKVKDTNERLNDLIDSAEETSLALNNATNRFMGLRNTQFIESRVYEDDETLPLKNPETEEKPKTSTETERLAEMKQAIVNGLEIIDKYYEKVEIPESDSESENDSGEANIVYKPVDPYSDRPLPYVIGTTEWHKYWHVGLGHSSSDSEIENEEEQFSESESEEEDVQVLPTRPRISDSESEDYSKNKISRPVANSTFNDQTTKNMFDSSSDSETGSLPPQVNTVNSNFAEELAAKLGKVESNIQVEVNTKPIQKPSTSIKPGGLFSDEPPPLDNDDIFVPKNDLFSGGNGLFDDDDDTDFWNTKTKPPIVSSINKVDNKKPSESTKDLFSEEQDDDIFNSKSNISESKPEKPVKKSLGLFDDDEDDLNEVDNIFNTSSLAQNKKTLFPSLTISKTAPIISEEPPEITSKKPEITKKPVGGVSILGPNVLLDSKIFQKRAASSSSSDSDNDSKDFDNSNKDFDNTNKDFDKNSIKDFDKNLNDNSNKESLKTTDKVEEAPKKLPNLFDDSSPLFTDDIFASSSIKKFSSKLFEAEEPPPLETKNNTNKKTSIFDEEPNDDFEDELFSPKPKIEKIPEASNKKATSLFLEDNDDDLFSTIDNSNKRGHSLFDPNPPSLIESKSNKTKSVNLFDPNPPELDESDEKSETTSSYGSLNAARAFLYDTEPPMLSNESSGISRDQSTRLESEDSSFNPYLTSSRRHSDIFQDTDSFLTPRNKVSFPEDTTQKSNLSGIPEIDSSSTKIDITASGNESSLVANAGDEDEDVFKTNISSEVKEKPIIQKKPNLFANEDEIKPKNIEKKSSLFDDDEDNSSIFKSKDEDKPKNIINEETRKNVFIAPKEDSDSDDDLFSFKNKKIDVDTKNKENDNKKFNYEQNLKSDEDIKVDPKKSLSFERNNENEKIGASSKEEIDGEIQSAGNSPGKLKHNLNINLQALLPGASPPKKKIEKSVSLESTESQNQSSSPPEEPLFKAPTPVLPNIQKPSFEKSVSFEAPVDHEILPNAVKERAKIPVKRRPSTRRARQEAIRKSAADLKFEDAMLENDENHILNISHSNNNNKVENETNPLSPSTDEEDFPTMPLVKDLSDNFTENSLFGKAPIISPIEDLLSKDVPSKEVPPKDVPSKEVPPKEDIPKEVPPKKEEPEDIFDIIKLPPQNLDLFSPSKSDQPNLFTNNMSASNTSKASIFSSSDSENDLFSTPKTEIKKDNSKVVLSSPDEDLFKPSSKTSYDDLFKNDPIFSKKKPLAAASNTKKSLFDDDDDDDDIFGGSSNSSSTKQTNTSNTSGSSASIKKPIVNKLKKMPVDPVEDILDPLEALLKK